MLDLSENKPNGDTTPTDIADDAPPNRREALFAPPQRAVVPRPVYRHRLLKALSSRLGAHLRAWSVERFMAALFFIFAFGVLGVFIADTLLCPEGTGVRFWDGCLYDVLGFGVGGGVIGFAAFVYLLRLLSLRRDNPTALHILLRQFLKSNVTHREDQ